MKKIIGIAGKARSGKDTVANYLWERYGFTRLAFADPVKMAAQIMFGLNNDQTWNPAFKEVEIPFWGMSPRQMFQTLGTDAAHTYFGNDIWIKRLAVSLGALPEDDIVIPDVRFESEADFVRGLGGVILHLERPDAEPVRNHVSERGIGFHPGDWLLPNDADLPNLYTRLESLIEMLP